MTYWLVIWTRRRGHEPRVDRISSEVRAGLRALVVRPWATSSPSVVRVDCCPAMSPSGEPCKFPAGWGTDHVGVGCCRLHDGVRAQP